MPHASNAQKHNAGRHLVVAEALLQGYDATIEGASTYVSVGASRVQVQVAAQGAWQVADVDKYMSGSIETVVLVDLTNGAREFYICPGGDLRAGIRQRYDAFVGSQGGQRPRNPESKHAAIYPRDVAVWKDDWQRLE